MAGIGEAIMFLHAATGFLGSLFGGGPEMSNETYRLLAERQELMDSARRMEDEMHRMQQSMEENNKAAELRLGQMAAEFKKRLQEQEKMAEDRQAGLEKAAAEREKVYREQMERKEKETHEAFQRMAEEMKRENEERVRFMKAEEARREKEAKEHAERLKTENAQQRARLQEEFDCREQERAAEQARRQEEFEQKQRERDVEAEEMMKEHDRMRQEMNEERARSKAEQQRLQEEMAEERQRLKAKFEVEMVEAKRKQEELHRAATAELKRKSREREDLLNAQMDIYKRGISPKVWPTDEEWRRARQRMYPDPQNEKFHCAVAGVSGSGKSSLINSLRGLTNRDSSAANVGVIETTVDITAYAHPSTTPPQNRWVWYDVPGAGTLSVPAPQYFNSQGLFVFDLIIVVVDNRFTTQDVAILQQCEYFKIPAFIVRSKANQHINNIMREELGYASDDSDSEENRKSLLEMAKRELVKNTRASFTKNLKEGELNAGQRVYIVSSDCVRFAVTSGDASAGKVSGRRGKRFEYIIDEWDLLKDLAGAIAQRRYTGGSHQR